MLIMDLLKEMVEFAVDGFFGILIMAVAGLLIFAVIITI